MSLIFLTAMSIDRYLTISTCSRNAVYPTRTILIPIVIGIILDLILPIIPQIIYTNLYLIGTKSGDGYKTLCLNTMPREYVKYYISYVFTFSFVIPLTIISFCYIKLVRYLRKQFRKRSESQLNGQLINYLSF